MRVGPPTGGSDAAAPADPVRLLKRSGPTGFNAQVPAWFLLKGTKVMEANESGAADEQLDGTCRRPRASRGLGHATDVVQQPTKCAVSMNFIVLNERGRRTSNALR